MIFFIDETNNNNVTQVSDSKGLPVKLVGAVLPTGAATAAKQDAGNTTLGSIDTAIGSKADAAATTDAGAFSLIALFKRWLERFTTVAGAAGTASTNVVSVQGVGYTGTTTVTRAANQTPYTAGDVVGGALTIAAAGPSAGDVLLTAIRIMLNITALPAGMSTFGLALYNATPPSAIADNSPWTLGAGDRAAYLTTIKNIPATLTGTGTASVVAELNDFIRQVKLVGGTSLFAYLITDGAFTPAANSETYDVKSKGILP